MKKLTALLILMTAFVLNGNAQSFLDELEKSVPGEGKVTVTQSEEIDELVNSAKLVRTMPKAPAKQEKKDNAAKQNGKVVADKTKPAGQKENTGSSQDSTDKTERVAKKMVFYRVQAFAGGNSRADRQAAEKAKSVIKARMPEHPVYVHFYSPRWICRVGNFRTYEDAEEVLKKVKALGYSRACIVKGKVSVAH